MKFFEACSLLLLSSNLLLLAQADIRTGERENRRPTRTVRPRDAPEPVQDEHGVVFKRRSRLDLRKFIFEQDKESIDIQLMSDEPAETFDDMTRADQDDDDFEAWHGVDEATGHSLTMVKSTSFDGTVTTAGTLYGENGTIYQVRTLADHDIIVEEVSQGMFDSEFEGVATETEGHADVDRDTIDQVDEPDNAQETNLRNRRLDGAGVIDVMVRCRCVSALALLLLVH